MMDDEFTKKKKMGDFEKMKDDVSVTSKRIYNIGFIGSSM